MKNKHQARLPRAICRLCRTEKKTEEDLKLHWEEEHQDKEQDEKGEIPCHICGKLYLNDFEDMLSHSC